MTVFSIIGVLIALIAAWVRFDPNAQAPVPTGVKKYRASWDVAVAMGALASLVAALGAIGWMSGRWPGALALWALAWALVAPWSLVVGVAIPLGWAKVAAYGAHWSSRVWRLDPRGGALVAGILAAMPRGGPDPSLRAWLSAKFGGGVFAEEPETQFGLGVSGVFHPVRTEAEAPLLPAGAVAVGLIDAAAGDVDLARGVLELIKQFDPRLRPPLGDRVAARWLAADAVARGEWTRLLAPVSGPWDPAVALARLVAGRLVGQVAPSPLQLWGAVLLTGRPALVGLARRAEVPPAPAPTVAAAPADALSGALAAHAQLLGDPRPERLRAAAVAWDATRVDNALATRIAARAAALGCSAAARDRVLAAAEADLAALVVGATLDVGVIEGPTLEAAARSIRERAVSDVEALAEGLGRRVRAKRWACGADELREWAGMTVAYGRAIRLGGEPVRRLLFGQVHREVCAQAVWLFNERGQKPLANAIFRWLLAEATAMSLEDLVRLQTKNVACGP